MPLTNSIYILECIPKRESLGEGAMLNEFLKRTQAKSLIAPVKIIESIDVAMWCTNFYYHLLTKNLSFNGCYDYMKQKFYVPGALQISP